MQVFSYCATAAMVMSIAPAMHISAQATEQSPKQLYRATHLPETEVSSTEGQKLGVLSEAMVDLSDGLIAYGLITFDDRNQFPSEFYAVPWRAFLPQRGQKVMLLQSQPDLFRDRIGFDPGKWPDFDNMKWARSVFQRFDLEPYWSVERYVDSTQALDENGGWAHRSKFESLYNPNRLEEVSGKVTAVARRRPMTGMARGLELTVDGKRVVLGPAWYMNQQDLAFNEGDEVIVQASPADLDGQQLYIASNIRKGKRDLRVRERTTGLPAWAPAITATGVDGEGSDVAQSRESWSNEQLKPAAIRLTHFMEMEVFDRNDRPSGKVSDLLFDRDTGEIAYLIITEKDQFTAVPWQVARVNKAALDNANKRKLMLDTTRRLLRDAPHFGSDSWPALGDSATITQVHDYFGVQPSWRPAPENRALAEAPQLPYQGEEVSITGYVAEVYRSAPRDDMEDGVMLVVATPEGTRRVYLGPAWYVMAQPFQVKRGDKVKVTGRNADVKGDEVLVTLRVIINDVQIVMRDSDGTPRWITGLSRN
ncbi:MAG: PRC-barrel domain-containing protein [Phycisphaerales bacterium]